MRRNSVRNVVSGRQSPLAGALSADDASFTVRCAGVTKPVVVNTASYTVLAPVRSAPPATRNTVGGKKNEVAVGTIHGEHRASTRYSADVLRRVLTALRPDFVLTEIAPIGCL